MRLTRRPKTITLLGLLLIGLFIPLSQKDTRSDAFMPPDHPALVYRDKVEEQKISSSQNTGNGSKRRKTM